MDADKKMQNRSIYPGNSLAMGNLFPSSGGAAAFKNLRSSAFICG
jgi:hypothetical protein